MIRLQEYQPGDVVLPAGELGKGFCILESGVLEVVRDSKVLSEIDMKGSIFGELSEILGLKRDANIIAKTEAKVRHVEESVADIVRKNPKVAIKLIKTLGRRLYRMNRIAAKEIEDKDTHNISNTLGVTVPVKSLCPCSKAVSDYGAHNQRSLVSVDVKADGHVWLEDVIEAVESSASRAAASLAPRITLLQLGWVMVLRRACAREARDEETRALVRARARAPSASAS